MHAVQRSRQGSIGAKARGHAQIAAGGLAVGTSWGTSSASKASPSAAPQAVGGIAHGTDCKCLACDTHRQFNCLLRTDDAGAIEQCAACPDENILEVARPKLKLLKYRGKVPSQSEQQESVYNMVGQSQDCGERCHQESNNNVQRSALDRGHLANDAPQKLVRKRMQKPLPPRPEWNTAVDEPTTKQSEAERPSLRIADPQITSQAPSDRAGSDRAAKPLRRRVNRPMHPQPEWNNDIDAAPLVDDGDVRSSTPSRSTPSRAPPREQESSRRGVQQSNTADTSYQPSFHRSDQTQRRNLESPAGQEQPDTSAAAVKTKGVASGRSARNPGSTIPKRQASLENDAELIPNVPARWGPSRHHVAELLHGVGCCTVGDLRRFLREIPMHKTVDAIFAADAACSAPGGVRDLKETQQCLEDLARLVAVSDTSTIQANQHQQQQVVASRPQHRVGQPSGSAQQVPFVNGVAEMQERARVLPEHNASNEKSVQSADRPLDRGEHLPARNAAVASLPNDIALGPSSQPPFEDTDQPDEPLLPCPHCGRTFREKVLERHIGKCQSINRERKVFNAVAHALPKEAIKAKSVHDRMEKRAAKIDPCDQPIKAKQGANWRAQSEAFRSAIKNARVVDECIAKGKPLPPPVPTAPEFDDRIQCQHCGRRFGHQQAERHIPICPKRKKR